MYIIQIFKEKRADEKILELYQILTKSDFKGYYEDTFVVEMLFTVLTLDLIINSKTPTTLKPKEIYNLAKEILRIYEQDDSTFSYLSVRNWIEATLIYMDDNKYTYDDIFKRNTYELREDVRKYLKKGDE